MNEDTNPPPKKDSDHEKLKESVPKAQSLLARKRAQGTDLFGKLDDSYDALDFFSSFFAHPTRSLLVGSFYLDLETTCLITYDPHKGV